MKSKSLARKLTLILVLLILPFNIVSVIATVYTVQNARVQTASSLESLAKLSMQQLDSRMSAMNDFFYNLEENRLDFQLYQKQGERTTDLVIAETSLAQYLNTIVSNEAFADLIFWQSEAYDRFYISVDSLQSLDEYTSLTCKEIIRSWLEADEKLEYTNWKLVEIENMSWVLKVYEKDGFYYGSMISLDELAYELKGSSGFSDLEVRFEIQSEDTILQEGMIEVSVSSGYSNIRMVVCVPKGESYSNLSVLQLLCIGFVILYVLLIPVLMGVIHGMVIRPLRQIGNAMEHLRAGEQDYRITEQTDTVEFQKINETFNSMADHISELKIENYEKELERQKMELRNLQLQIRPHFLLNMFNLLYSFAQIENYQSIQKLALYLSEYFRYLFQSGKDLQPFGRELELIKKYVEMAGMRYPDCCDAVFEIDPEVLEVEVPPLLIHNFVENVFKHAGNQDKRLHLRIEAFADEKVATFMIVDDGPGMPQQMVDDINHGVFHAKEDDRVHVGIENSWQRLRYFYGDKAGLTVESAPGEGTCFTILIPVKR